VLIAVPLLEADHNLHPASVELRVECWSAHT
jgi:hypothetical protein